MSELKVNSIKGLGSDELPANLKPITASAWLFWDGVTNTIKDAFNISSITDNGLGDQTINFENTFSNANYAACVNSGDGVTVNVIQNTRAHTVSSVRIFTRIGSSGAATDTSLNSLVIFGGQ